MYNESIFKLTQAELKTYLTRRYAGSVSQDGFVYVKGELPVMLVAHLDTVHKNPVREICKTKDDTVWMSPQGIGGDDRCGVIIIENIIQNLMLDGYPTPHILFTEDEEIGGIGADKFCKSGITPDVKFLVEFDRIGSNDAVFYDCDNPEFTKFITDFDFEEEYGSFSDISTIAPHLGVAAVNISSGYFRAHTLSEYVDFSAMYDIIERGTLILEEADEDYVPTYDYVESLYVQKLNSYYTNWNNKGAYANYAPKTSTYNSYLGNVGNDDDDDDDNDNVDTPFDKLGKYYSQNYGTYISNYPAYAGQGRVVSVEACEGGSIAKDNDGNVYYIEDTSSVFVDMAGVMYYWDYSNDEVYETDFHLFNEEGLPYRAFDCDEFLETVKKAGVFDCMQKIEM